MRSKQLRTLIELRQGEASMKALYVATGSGKSNDDCEAAAWRKVKRQIREQHPGATFRVRSLYYAEAV